MDARRNHALALAAISAIVAGSVLGVSPAVARPTDPGSASESLGYTVRDTARHKPDMDACYSGHFCVEINDKTYDFFRCGTFPVSGWVGAGLVFNNQTPGQWASLRDKNLDTYKTLKSGFNGYVDMTPVYFVQPC
jgi:hypothetical protein